MERNKYVQIYVKPVGVISVDFIGDSFSSTVTIWEIWGVNAMPGLTTSSKGSTWLHTWFQEQYAIKTKSQNSFRASNSVSACDSKDQRVAQTECSGKDSTNICVKNWIRFFSGVTRPYFQAHWIHTIWELVFPVKPWTFLKTQTPVTKTHKPLTQQS